MAKIPQKPGRTEGSVQRRVAGAPRESLGRVGRITHDARDTANGRRRRRSRRDARYGAAGTNHGEILRRWLMVALGLAGVAICSILVWTLLRQANPPKKPGHTSGATGTESSAASSLSASDAVAMVSGMLEAESAADLEPLLRQGDIDTGEALDRIREIREDLSETASPKWLGSIDAIAQPIEFVALPRKFSGPLLVPLTPDAQHRWRIDFDAMTGHCEPPFSDLVEGRSEQGLVRAMGRIDTYFNGPFRDEDVWMCIALSQPDEDGIIYGYCRRDGFGYRAIEVIERRNRRATTDAGMSPDRGNAFRTTLRLRKVENSLDRQYQITEVVSDDWVVGDRTLEEILRQRAEEE